MSTASPRDIIAKEVAASVFGSARAMPSDHVHADNLLSALTAAGYRVVREGELDAATEALKPFADLSKRFDDAAAHFGTLPSDDLYKPRIEGVTHGQLRAARAAFRALVGEAK